MKMTRYYLAFTVAVLYICDSSPPLGMPATAFPYNPRVVHMLLDVDQEQLA